MNSYNCTTLSFLGGTGDANNASMLLGAFSLSDMHFMLVETLDDSLSILSADREWLIKQADRILRLHVFGEGGDLKLRRDGSRLFWTYIGFEKPNVEARDFWTENQTDELFEENEPLTALLWGKYDESLGYWYDDRVRGAGDRLTYLAEPVPQVVSVTARLRDSATGQTVAYWTRSLRPAEEGA